MQQSVDPASRREAVQPSLWDRLVDDLPGLVAETEAQRTALSQEIGAERSARLVDGGARAIAREEGLRDETRRRLLRLVERLERRRRLEEAGIVVTAPILREAVRRDIEALFNTERLEADVLLTDAEHAHYESSAELLADFPEVRRSVLNFGVPSFAGRIGSDFDRDALARELKDILAVFEPRLRRDSVRVKVEFGDRVGMRVEIDGVLMLTPVPERLRLSTTIDLDSGRAVTDVEEG